MNADDPRPPAPTDARGHTAGFHAIPEAELEPVELIAQSGTVHRAGRLALSAGHGSYRVKSHMERVGTALGLDSVRALVTLTEITTTSLRGPIFRTEVSEVRGIGVNTDRLAELENYIGDLPQRASLAQINAEITRIASKPPLYQPWFNALAAGMACAAVAFLNHGGLVEVIAVLIAAALGQYLRRAAIRQGFNQFGTTMVAAAVAALAYLGLIVLAGDVFGVPGRHEAGYVSAVLFLVPGFPLVTGALDLARLDFSAGISRLTYALMILVSAALSLWAVSTLVGLTPDPVVQVSLPPVLNWTLLAAASFLGVLGFALMFNSPWHMALGAASVGMVANVVRLVVVNEAGWMPQAGAALAALVVGLAARMIATPLRVPRVCVSVPAVVIMVPGVAAYRAVFAFNNDDILTALGFFADAALVIVALSIGLAIARMLTDDAWRLEGKG